MSGRNLLGRLATCGADDAHQRPPVLAPLFAESPEVILLETIQEGRDPPDFRACGAVQETLAFLGLSDKREGLAKGTRTVIYGLKGGDLAFPNNSSTSKRPPSQSSGKSTSHPATLIKEAEVTGGKWRQTGEPDCLIALDFVQNCCQIHKQPIRKHTGVSRHLDQRCRVPFVHSLLHRRYALPAG